MTASYPELAGQTAIVTGVASVGGLGEAIARGLGAQGVRVAAVDLDADGAERVAASIREAGGQAFALRADLTRVADVQATVGAVLKQDRKVDILVNNVGGFERLRPIAEVDEEEWDRIVDLNLKTMFFCCQAVHGAMIERGRGRIVNLASVAGRARVHGLPDPVHYSATKGGVLALSRTLAAELAPHLITVNAVAPGPTRTARFLRVRGADAEERLREFLPLARLSVPDDVVAAVLYLVSDGAANVTGAVLDVNAGVAMI